ncbi:MAG: hypothetical protein K2X80_06525 [Pseudomonadaceae bacterium]|nr:hypothetical protein [Pseudomonadaceae bacterium]
MTKCHQLKMAASDGKQRLTDAANAETLLRLVLFRRVGFSPPQRNSTALVG